MNRILTRKDFLRAALFVTGGSATLAALARCGGGNGSGADMGSVNSVGGGGTVSSGLCANGAVNGTITNNHGHTLSVPSADIQAGAQKSYNIQGASSHPHTITITPAQFALLAQNQTFTVTSTSDAGHTHDVTVRCA